VGLAYSQSSNELRTRQLEIVNVGPLPSKLGVRNDVPARREAFRTINYERPSSKYSISCDS
jgi:hypothetical protein